MAPEFPHAQAQVDALIRDYEQARDDERHFVALQGTAITLALTALSLLGALAFKSGEGRCLIPSWRLRLWLC